MTVASTDAAVDYVGDGVTKAFLIPFEMLDPTDMLVFFDRVQQPAAYAISGDVTQQGSTLTFNTAPANGVAIQLLRSTPMSQDTIYTPHGPYKAKQVESDFDKAILIAQELRNRIDHPPTGIDAIDVNFTPTGSVSATNVQAAVVEVATDAAGADAAILQALTIGLQGRALIGTKVVSSDTDVLQVLNPTLADDVTLVPKSNVPLGHLKLDASGHIPTSLLPSIGLVFKGVWDPNIQGATPPPSGNTQGDFYIFSAVGNVTLAEQTNTTPHTVSVFINDTMVWDAAVSKWFYINSAQFQIITAAGVIFVPVGTISATNVQLAIAELDASISQRFLEEGDEVSMYRFNGIINEPVIKSYADGIRLFVNGRDVVGTFSGGVLVFGAQQSDSVAQNSRIDLRSIDGIPLGSVGFSGDPSGRFLLKSYRNGGTLAIAITDINGTEQTIISNFSDGTVIHQVNGLPALWLLGGGNVAIFSEQAATDPAVTAKLTASANNGAQLWSIGFNGGALFEYALSLSSGFQWSNIHGILAQLTESAFYGTADIIAQRDAYSLSPAPTSPAHLTRKDYVDNLVAGSGGFASIATAVTAPFSVPHGLGVVPGQIWGTLVCQIANAGYAVGDVIPLPLPHNITIPISNAVVSAGYGIYADVLSVGFTRASIPPNIVPKGGGTLTPLIEADWKIVLNARK